MATVIMNLKEIRQYNKVEKTDAIDVRARERNNRSVNKQAYAHAHIAKPWRQINLPPGTRSSED